jgi:hypothetical protein
MIGAIHMFLMVYSKGSSYEVYIHLCNYKCFYCISFPLQISNQGGLPQNIQNLSI